jgi:hypothetical protein
MVRPDDSVLQAVKQVVQEISYNPDGLLTIVLVRKVET